MSKSSETLTNNSPLKYSPLEDSQIVVDDQRKTELDTLNLTGKDFVSINIDEDFVKAEDVISEAITEYNNQIATYYSYSGDVVIDNTKKSKKEVQKDPVSKGIIQIKKNSSTDYVHVTDTDPNSIDTTKKHVRLQNDTSPADLRKLIPTGTGVGTGALTGYVQSEYSAEVTFDDANRATFAEILKKKISQEINKNQKFQHYSNVVKNKLIEMNCAILTAQIDSSQQDTSLQKNISTTHESKNITAKYTFTRKGGRNVETKRVTPEVTQQSPEEEAKEALKQAISNAITQSSLPPKQPKDIDKEHLQKLQTEVENLCKAEYLQRCFTGLYAVQHLSVHQHESAYLTKPQKEQLFAVDLSPSAIDEILSSFKEEDRPALLNQINLRKTDGKITNFQLLETLKGQSAWEKLDRDSQSTVEIKLSGKMLSSAQNDIFTEFEAMLDQILHFEASDQGWKRSKGVVAFDTGHGKSFLVDDIICKYNGFNEFFKNNAAVKKFFENSNPEKFSGSLATQISQLEKAKQEAGGNVTKRDQVAKELKLFQQIAQDPAKYLKQYQLYAKGFEIININLANKDELEKKSQGSESLHGKVVIIDEAIFINDYTKQIRNLVDKGAKVIAVGATLSYAKTLEDIERKTDKIPNKRQLQDYRDELKQLQVNDEKSVLSQSVIDTRIAELNNQINTLEESSKKDSEYDSYSRKTEMAKDNLAAIKERQSKTEARLQNDETTLSKLDSNEINQDNWTASVISGSAKKGKTQNIIPGLKLSFGKTGKNNSQLQEIASETKRLVAANFIKDGKHKIALIKAGQQEIKIFEAGSDEFKAAVKNIPGTENAIMIYAGDYEFVVGGDYSNLSVLKEGDKQNIFLSKEEHVNIDLIKQMIGRDRSGLDDISREIFCSSNSQVNTQNKSAFIESSIQKVQDKTVTALLGNLNKKIAKRLDVKTTQGSNTGKEIVKSAKLSAVLESLTPDQKKQIVSGELILDSAQLNKSGASNYFKEVSVIAKDSLSNILKNVRTDSDEVSAENARPTNCTLTDISHIKWNDEDHASSSYKLNRDVRSYIFWESIKGKTFNFSDYPHILKNPQDYGLDEEFAKSVENLGESPALDEKFTDLAFKISHCEKTTFAKRRDFLNQVKEGKLSELQESWDRQKTEELSNKLKILQSTINTELDEARIALKHEGAENRKAAAEKLQLLEGKIIGDISVAELIEDYKKQIEELNNGFNKELEAALKNTLKQTQDTLNEVQNLGRNIIQTGVEDLNSLRTSLKQAQKLQNEAQSQNASSQEEQSKLKSDLKNQIEDNIVISTKISTLEQEKIALKKQNQEQVSRIEQLEKDKSEQTQLHAEQLAQSQANKSTEDQRIRDDLAHQIEKNVRLEETERETKTELAELKTTLQETEDEIKELTTILQEAQDRDEDLSRTNTKSKDTIDSLRQNVSFKKTGAIKLSNKIKRLLTQIESNATALEESSATIKKLETLTSQSGLKITQLSQEKKDLEQTLEETKQAHEKEKNELSLQAESDKEEALQAQRVELEQAFQKDNEKKQEDHATNLAKKDAKEETLNRAAKTNSAQIGSENSFNSQARKIESLTKNLEAEKARSKDLENKLSKGQENNRKNPKDLSLPKFDLSSIETSSDRTPSPRGIEDFPSPTKYENTQLVPEELRDQEIRSLKQKISELEKATSARTTTGRALQEQAGENIFHKLQSRADTAEKTGAIQIAELEAQIKDSQIKHSAEIEELKAQHEASIKAILDNEQKELESQREESSSAIEGISKKSSDTLDQFIRSEEESSQSFLAGDLDRTPTQETEKKSEALANQLSQSKQEAETIPDKLIQTQGNLAESESSTQEKTNRAEIAEYQASEIETITQELEDSKSKIKQLEAESEKEKKALQEKIFKLQKELEENKPTIFDSLLRRNSQKLEQEKRNEQIAEELSETITQLDSVTRNLEAAQGEARDTMVGLQNTLDETNQEFANSHQQDLENPTKHLTTTKNDEQITFLGTSEGASRTKQTNVLKSTDLEEKDNLDFTTPTKRTITRKDEQVTSIELSEETNPNDLESTSAEQQNTQDSPTPLQKLDFTTPSKKPKIEITEEPENPEWFAAKKIVRAMNKLYAVRNTLDFGDFITNIDSIQNGTTADNLKTINETLFKDHKNLSLTMADISVLDQMDGINRKLASNPLSKSSEPVGRDQLREIWGAYEKSTSASDIAKILVNSSTQLPKDSEVTLQLQDVENAPISEIKSPTKSPNSSFKITKLTAGIEMSPAKAFMERNGPGASVAA